MVLHLDFVYKMHYQSVCFVDKTNRLVRMCGLIVISKGISVRFNRLAYALVE
jgi:hypothetical protein